MMEWHFRSHLLTIEQFTKSDRFRQSGRIGWQFVSGSCDRRIGALSDSTPLERFSARTFPLASSCLPRPQTLPSSTPRLGLPHSFGNSARSTARGRIIRL